MTSSHAYRSRLEKRHSSRVKTFFRAELVFVFHCPVVCETSPLFHGFNLLTGYAVVVSFILSHYCLLMIYMYVMLYVEYMYPCGVPLSVI